MKTHNAINNLKPLSNEILDFSDSFFKKLPIYFIDNSYVFGMIQINYDVTSTVLYNRAVNILVTVEQIDNFLCVFLKNRIVLFEKINKLEKTINTIKIKYWERIVDLEESYDHYFLFECVQSNVVHMNNSTEILIPFFEKG